MGDCLEICDIRNGTHKLCKLNNYDSYNKLNKFFE